MNETPTQIWIGVGFDGRILSGGHNRQRIYHKSRENAIKHGSRDNRVKAIIQFERGETIWSIPPSVEAA